MRVHVYIESDEITVLHNNINLAFKVTKQSYLEKPDIIKKQAK